MSEIAVGGDAAASSALDTLAACLAGLRSTLMHTRAAFDAWSEGADPYAPLEAADGAWVRARAQAAALRTVLPGHARRVRLADRAVERVAAALNMVRGLLPMTPVPLTASVDPDSEAVTTERALLEVTERAFGTAERAVLAAGSQSMGTPIPAS